MPIQLDLWHYKFKQRAPEKYLKRFTDYNEHMPALWGKVLLQNIWEDLELEELVRLLIDFSHKNWKKVNLFLSLRGVDTPSNTRANDLILLCVIHWSFGKDPKSKVQDQGLCSTSEQLKVKVQNIILQVLQFRVYTQIHSLQCKNSHHHTPQIQQKYLLTTVHRKQTVKAGSQVHLICQVSRIFGVEVMKTGRSI